MEILRGKKVDLTQIQNRLLRIDDVEYFEGPLMTLFQNFKDNQLFLFDWVQSDVQFNRWMVYRTSSIFLTKYINGEISHFNLFMSEEPFCYFIDIDDSLVWNNCLTIEKNKIPSTYIPKKEVFFKKHNCPNISRLNEFVQMKAVASR